MSDPTNSKHAEGCREISDAVIELARWSNSFHDAGNEAVGNHMLKIAESLSEALVKVRDAHRGKASQDPAEANAGPRFLKDLLERMREAP